ncbi:MAG: D-2-hydroxyacid dehydrogenase family protein [Alphaproteobacteria bacterium]|nr:D-2-hydroxyacid dehydrogenase family protein [Alphaproteobacteria bacterium]
MPRIAVIDDYLNNALRMADWSKIAARAEIVVFNDHAHDDAAVVGRLRDFDIVCAMRERTWFSRAVLQRLPKLRLLCSTAPRNAAVDVAAAHELGIMCCGTRAPNGATAELTWGLILALLRNIPGEHQHVREGGWQQRIGRDVSYLTLGVIGLGRLGAQVAKVGKAFGMKVLAWSPNLTPERAAPHAVEAVSKERLLAEADIVTLHMVLRDSTRGLMAAADFARMKREAVFINTSRGPLADEAALLRALESGTIAGAALDAFAVEPLPLDHPFRRLSNVVITPHVGYVTEKTYRMFFEDTVENILGFLDGKPVRVMNPRAGDDRNQPSFLP